MVASCRAVSWVVLRVAWLRSWGIVCAVFLRFVPVGRLARCREGRLCRLARGAGLTLGCLLVASQDRVRVARAPGLIRGRVLVVLW